MTRGPRLLVILVASAILVEAGGALAAIERPSYTPGDRWVYEVEGSLDRLPGLDESGFGNASLTLTGRTEVEVTAIEANGTVRALARTTGALNGSFPAPGGIGTVIVTGTLTSQATEEWEPDGFFAVASNGTTTYLADITFVLTTRLDVRARITASSTVTFAGPPFPLDVGASASGVAVTDLTANTTFTIFGETTSMENRTTIESMWHRDVIAQETVSVVAGTFDAYELNQSLAPFQGFPGIPIAEANETAYFSNDVGNYVRRTVYVNGSAIAEMQLRSYSYAARAAGAPLPFLAVLLIATGAAAAVGIAVWLVRRRRRAKARGPGRQEP